MGHEASKNQQLEDHYFGAIPTRVAAFMKDLEIQALELGIPVKYIGVGETIDDLQKFNADEFVNALFDVKTSEERN